jgi:hypothetical protein
MRYRRAPSASVQRNVGCPPTAAPGRGEISVGGTDCFWKLDVTTVEGEAETPEPSALGAGRTTQW